jgi:hypothetical protein
MVKKVNISQVDVLLLNWTYPIEFLLYFPKGLDTRKIRKALKKLSSVFWPMFGLHRNGVISFKEYAEDDFYNEKVINQNFMIPETEVERYELYSRYSPPDLKQLFFLEIKRFKNGMVLIPQMKHLAGDGYSYFYFLSSLAVLSQPTLLPSKSSLMQLFFKPHHRRTILRSFSSKEIERELVQQDSQFSLEVERVPRKDVNSWIRKVLESKNFRISSNDILTAMALKKLTGAQKEFKDEFIELTIPIDVRRKVKEYGRRFFGNGIMLHSMRLKRSDIEDLAVEDIAIEIRKSMPSISKQSYTAYLAKLEEIISEGKTEKLRPFDPKSGFLVTNISRLPIEKLDFGTGPPDLIFPLTLEKNTAAVMAKDESFVLRFVY